MRGCGAQPQPTMTACAVTAHCRGCGATRRFKPAGNATSDGRENVVRPRALYRTCAECAHRILSLQTVLDSEGLARNVVDRWAQATSNGRVGATGQPHSSGTVDLDDLLQGMEEWTWRRYLTWDPSKGVGSFLSYASQWLPEDLKALVAAATGEPFHTRTTPKAHSGRVSTSLDAIVDAFSTNSTASATGVTLTDAAAAVTGRGRLERAYAGVQGNAQAGGDAVLLRLLAE